MVSRRQLLKGAAFGAAGGLLSGPAFAQSAPAQIKRGGTLTVAITADPQTLDPHFAGALQGRAVNITIHDTLLRLDDRGRLSPGLAESWTQPDDKTITLTLRPDLKFHDGTPLDAAAVKFNIDRIRDPATIARGSLRSGEILNLDAIEVVDARTVKLTLKRPFAAFLFPFADMVGCIGSPTAYQKWGPDYRKNPAGAGPYKVVEYINDSRLVLEKNPDYWDKGKPYLDRLVLRPIPVESTRLTELRANGVQIAEALPLQEIGRLRQSNEIVVSEKVGYRWDYFGFNMADPYPGKSKALRQAFQWAIDREALHQVAYYGTGAIAFDGILPGSPFHDPDYKPYRRDVEKAKRLIGESGLGGNITVQAPIYPYAPAQRAAQVFQANAAEIGVNVQIQQVDDAGFRQLIRSGKVPVDLCGWWGYRADPDQYLSILLHSSGNYAKSFSYKNPKMDELIEAERGAHTEAERRKYFREIAALMNDDAIYVPWHYGSDFKGLQRNVKGFFHAQDGIIRFQEIWLA
ncbi:MAG: ABC transporter substrate-binding protein [Pseudorhodoplanes sp.]